MPKFRWSVLLVAGILAAASTAPAAAQDASKPTEKVKKDPNLITAEEIAQRTEITNAYDAIKLLRPSFLRTTRTKAAYSAPSTNPSDPYNPSGSTGGSGSGTAGGAYVTAVLYIDDIKFIRNNPDETLERPLAAIRANEILEIRYLSGSSATARYGADHQGGAILLKKKP